MHSTPEALAKAAQLHNKVVAITNGTSPLGNVLCEQAAIAGATVYSLDADLTALARQAISFRQNNLRLRCAPCDMENKSSILDAIQEITSHAPPIDLWVHALPVSDDSKAQLNCGLFVFGQHFDRSGKGSISLILNAPIEEQMKQQLTSSIKTAKVPDVVSVNLTAYDAANPKSLAARLLLIEALLPGVHVSQG